MTMATYPGASSLRRVIVAVSHCPSANVASCCRRVRPRLQLHRLQRAKHYGSDRSAGRQLRQSARKDGTAQFLRRQCSTRSSRAMSRSRTTTTAAAKTGIHLKASGKAQIANVDDMAADEIDPVVDFLIEQKKSRPVPRHLEQLPASGRSPRQQGRLRDGLLGAHGVRGQIPREEACRCTASFLSPRTSPYASIGNGLLSAWSDQLRSGRYPLTLNDEIRGCVSAVAWDRMHGRPEMSKRRTK